MGELLAKGLLRMAIMQTGDQDSLVELNREIKECVKDIVEKGRNKE